MNTQSTATGSSATDDSIEQLTFTNWIFCRTPTENMMRWMKSFDRPCERACCYSVDCASIRCSFCFVSLTSADRPSLSNFRMECVECPLVIAESFENAADDVYVSQTTMCAACFHSVSVKHHHTIFCKIVSEGGQHSVCRRSVPAVPLLSLTKSDFHSIALGHECLLLKNYCSCCYEPFREDRMAVATPGCDANHGIAEHTRNGDIVDSKGYFCIDCAYSWYSSKGSASFCDITSCCVVCKHVQEVKQWKQDFATDKMVIARSCDFHESEYFNRIREHVCHLKSLHKQPWIQKIIDECFS